MGYDLHVVDRPEVVWYESLWTMAGFRSLVYYLGLLGEAGDSKIDADVETDQIPLERLSDTSGWLISGRHAALLADALDGQLKSNLPAAITAYRDGQVDIKWEEAVKGTFSELARLYSVKHQPLKSDAEVEEDLRQLLVFFRIAAKGGGFHVC